MARMAMGAGSRRVMSHVHSCKQLACIYPGSTTWGSAPGHPEAHRFKKKKKKKREAGGFRLGDGAAILVVLDSEATPRAHLTPPSSGLFKGPRSSCDLNIMVDSFFCFFFFF
jgi:hypothetical protein